MAIPTLSCSITNGLRKIGYDVYVILGVGCFIFTPSNVKAVSPSITNGLRKIGYDFYVILGVGCFIFTPNNVKAVSPGPVPDL